jgi:heme exporter protein D
MQFNTWSEFLAMGGYGYFVWMSFGVSAAVLLLEVLVLKAQRKKTLRALQTRLRMSNKMKGQA